MPRGRTRKPVKDPKPPVEKTEDVYVAPAWAWRYLGACLNPDIKQTVTARCAEAKISQTTFYAHLKRPEFVKWLNQKREEAFSQDERHEVRQALVRRCLTGDLEAIRLYHELYERFIPTERHIFDGDLSQVSDASLDDLERVLAQAGAAGKGSQVN